jgi:hypothetical protein
MSLARRSTAEQLFLLDTRGWCVVEDALTPAEVQDLLRELQAATKLDTSAAGAVGELMPHQSATDASVRRWPFPYHYGPCFTSLIDNPRITPLLQRRLGADIKLDHEYVQTLKPNGSGAPVARGGIHGGPANHASRARSIHARSIQGSARGEMLTVVYELLTVNPEDGGFGAVTGSHKTQLELPISRQVDPLTLTYPDLVTRVSAKAGAAIVFTEYMMHTTYPWTGEGERKSVFYK